MTGAPEHVPFGTTLTLGALRSLRQRAGLAAPALGRSRALSPSGSRASRARSRGMEYAESRAYVPGDDMRHMDWRVTARTTHPHTKVFHESRSRDVVLAVELSPSMRFGTRCAFKSVVAAHAAMLLAWASVEVEDRVGAVVCTGRDLAVLPPAAGPGPALTLAGALVNGMSAEVPSGAAGEGADLGAALVRGGQLLRGPGLLVVVSDFYGLDERCTRQLQALAARRDVLLCLVLDVLEMEPPPAGRYPISDGTALAFLDTRSAAACAALRRQFDERVARLRELARGPRVACIAVGTGTDVAAVLGEQVPVERARERFCGR